MRNHLLLLFMILISAQSFGDTSQCREILLTAEIKNAQSFINYFDGVFKGSDETVILALEKIIQTIDENKVIENPISEYESARSSINLLRRDTFNRLIEKLNLSITLDLTFIRDWATQQITEKQSERSRRQEAKEDTESVFSGPFIFHRVRAGELTKSFSYERSESSSQAFSGKKVTLTTKLSRDFEVQETPVTQGQWFDIMGENPAVHSDSASAISTLSESGLITSVHTEFKMENISFLSMLVFANKLSIQEGYKPAYDLSLIVTEGDASLGTLSLKVQPVYGLTSDEARQLELLKLLKGFPNGNVYEAEGYRLPTSVEWEFLARDRGIQTNVGVYDRPGHDGLERGFKSTEDIAMPIISRLSTNIDNTVGMHTPLLIEEKPIYDIYGGIEEVVFDSVTPYSNKPDEVHATELEAYKDSIDLTGSLIGVHTRGGPNQMSGGYSVVHTGYLRAPDGKTGFRLVRTLFH